MSLESVNEVWNIFVLAHFLASGMKRSIFLFALLGHEYGICWISPGNDSLYTFMQ